jgi:glycosyltransferase involved in cell wall biosynthesis
MSNLPTITVIIPTYNHAQFLKEALTSLLAQTYTDWEALVVNNFSDDDTVAVVNAFNDSRIVLENFHNNGNIASSRNRGIELARGKYIAFLDSDDTWYPKKLAKCMVFFENDVDLICHGLRRIGDEDRDMFCGPEELATFDALLYEGNCITPSATVVTKEMIEAVGCFSEEHSLVTAEDYHLWIKLLRVGCRTSFIKEILGEYRIHSGNLSSSVLRHLSAELQVIVEFFPSEDVRNLRMKMRIRRRYCIAYYGAGRGMQRNGQFIQSLPLLIGALAYWPWYLKAYIAIIFSVLIPASQLVFKFKQR